MKHQIIATIAIALFLSVNCSDYGFFDDELEDWRHDIFDPVGPVFWPYNHFNPASRRKDTKRDDSEHVSVQKPKKDPEPLEVETISGTIGNPDDINIETNGDRNPFPGTSFHDIFGVRPYFGGNPFFNFGNFGNFGNYGGFGPQALPTPWYKGSNVCTERKEDVEDWDENGDEKPPQNFHFGLHVSFDSCVEKFNKRSCKSVTNVNGKKKTVTITQQCCHGFSRLPNANFNAPCEKVDLHTIAETAKSLGDDLFVQSAMKNELEDNLSGNLTLFLPTNIAFAKYADQLNDSNYDNEILRNEVTDTPTREVILNHIVDGWNTIEEIENEQLYVTEFDNSTIRMNIFPRPPNDQNYEYLYRYTANCAPIVKVNQMAENGIIHVVDRVVPIVTDNLMKIIRDRPDMAVFRTVLEKTNLAEQLENEKRAFTVFAPTNSAFEKLSPHLRRSIKDGKGCALNILKNHILDLTFCSVAVLNNVKTGAVNELGIKMTFERDYDNVQKTSALSDEQTALEANDLSGIKDIIVNGEARVLESDIMGTNGVLHIIDTLLQTESGMPATSVFERHNLTVFNKLIEASGFDARIDSLENVSYFVPIDKAFENNEWKIKLDENPESLKDNKDLLNFIQYHIAEPLVKTCDFTNDNVMKTESGDGVRVNLYSTSSLFTNIMNRATVNCARLLHFDDETCGSVVHQIDRVLTPPYKNLFEALKANEKYSMFFKLIKAANLTDYLLDDKQNATVLVLTNDIFSELNELYEDLLTKPDLLDNFIKTHILQDVICCSGIVHSSWPFTRFVQTINNHNLSIDRDYRPKIQNAGITKCDIIANNGIIHEINDAIRTMIKPRDIPFEEIFFK